MRVGLVRASLNPEPEGGFAFRLLSFGSGVFGSGLGVEV